MAVIRLVSVGDVPKKYIEVLLEDLNNQGYDHKFVFSDEMDIPDEAYDDYRQQYDARQLLEHAREKKTVLVTNADLYAGRRNFVFGLSKDGGPAIVSVARLDPRFYGNQMNFGLTTERLKKEVIHEVGHIFDMDHCNNRQCVMAFSQHFSDIDDKEKTFCNNCQLRMSTEGIKI